MATVNFDVQFAENAYTVQFEETSMELDAQFEPNGGGGGGGAVNSVNGKTGTVVLDAGDLEYDDSETYSEGSIGAELSSLNGDKAPIIEDTASGAIASFPDGAALPVKSLSVAVEPVQDLHGQSNPYPPGGGKNMLKPYKRTVYASGVTYSVADDGKITLLGTATGDNSFSIWTSASGITVPETSDYTVSLNGAVNAKINGSATATLNVTANNVPSRFAITITNGITYNESFYVQIEKGSSATAYAPYSNICPINGWTQAKVTRSSDNSITDTYTIDLNGTRYGGTLDVTTGVLTVDRAILNDFTGLTANGTSSTGAYRYKLVVTGCAGYTVKPVISNVLKYNAEFNGKANEVYNSAGWMNIFLNASTAENAIDFLEDNNTVIVYPLATPTTVQLTPQEVTTLLGQNNIWSDTGNTTVEYRADTKLYINKVLNA